MRRKDINKMTRKQLAVGIVKKQMADGMKFEKPSVIVRGMLKGAGAARPQSKDSLIAGYYAVNNPDNVFYSKTAFDGYGVRNNKTWRGK